MTQGRFCFIKTNNFCSSKDTKRRVEKKKNTKKQAIGYYLGYIKLTKNPSAKPQSGEKIQGSQNRPIAERDDRHLQKRISTWPRNT